MYAFKNYNRNAYIKFCSFSVARCSGTLENCSPMDESGFDHFVGAEALKYIASENYCECKEGFYGANCNLDLDSFEKSIECGEGMFDKGNTLTGCSCRNSTGQAIEFHGWYCERDNR